MFEEHVIIMDIFLEENQGQKLGSWGDAAHCKMWPRDVVFPPRKAVRGGRKDAGPCWGSGWVKEGSP